MGPAFIEIKVEEVAAIFVGGLVSLAADTFITPLLGNNGFMPNFFSLFNSLGNKGCLKLLHRRFNYSQCYICTHEDRVKHPCPSHIHPSGTNWIVVTVNLRVREGTSELRQIFC